MKNITKNKGGTCWQLVPFNYLLIIGTEVENNTMDRKYKEQTKSPHAPALSQVRVLLPACVRGAPLLRSPTDIHSGNASEPGGRTVHPPGVSCEGVTMTAGRVGPPAAPWGRVGGPRTPGSAMSGSRRVGLRHHSPGQTWTSGPMSGKGGAPREFRTASCVRHRSAKIQRIVSAFFLQKK